MPSRPALPSCLPSASAVFLSAVSAVFLSAASAAFLSAVSAVRLPSPSEVLRPVVSAGGLPASVEWPPPEAVTDAAERCQPRPKASTREASAPSRSHAERRSPPS